MMKDYKYIRKHRRLLKMGRAFESRFGWLIAILQRIARILGWIGHKLRFLRVLRYLNPLRYIKRLDWYIIKKFVGYYFFSIALIITIAIVFDFNENLAKFTEYHAPTRAIISTITPTSFPTSPTSSVRCSCSWLSFSSPRSWQATLKSLPSWHRAFHSSDFCVLISSPA